MSLDHRRSIPLTSLTVSHLPRRTCLWTIGECRLFVFVQFSDLWSEVIVRFVDTGANVYPQYLNFLFISLAFLP